MFAISFRECGRLARNTGKPVSRNDLSALAIHMRT
jgi:hypothetical protein